MLPLGTLLAVLAHLHVKHLTCLPASNHHHTIEGLVAALLPGSIAGDLDVHHLNILLKYVQ